MPKFPHLAGVLAAGALLLSSSVFAQTPAGAPTQAPVKTQAEAPPARVASQPESPAAAAVRARATAFNEAMVKVDGKAMQSFVAPGSWVSLEHKEPGVVKATVDSIELDEAGTTAVVHNLRTYFQPQLQGIDWPVADTWKLIDGQWYVDWPKPQAGEQMTPYGKMVFTPGGTAPVGAAPSASPQAFADKVTQNVDPDQYLRALARIEAQEKAKEAEAAKQKQQEEAQKAAASKPTGKKSKKAKKTETPQS